MTTVHKNDVLVVLDLNLPGVWAGSAGLDPPVASPQERGRGLEQLFRSSR
jgi:hypothetical protein